MNETTSTDKAISRLVKAMMRQKALNQKDIANAIDRKAQSYVSDRLNGKASWSISELDTIAPMLGYPDALTLIAAARGYAPMIDVSDLDDDSVISDEEASKQRTLAKLRRDGLGIAAHHDDNKEAQREHYTDAGA